MSEQFKVYGYRWVVLGVFMFINLTIQMLWITYAPITGPAAEFYGVSDLQIGLLAMTFMIAFIPLSIPVSWVIDTYGFRVAVGIGAALMGIFGLCVALPGATTPLVLWSTIGIAISQPFLLNHGRLSREVVSSGCACYDGRHGHIGKFNRHGSA